MYIIQTILNTHSNKLVIFQFNDVSHFDIHPFFILQSMNKNKINYFQDQEKSSGNVLVYTMEHHMTKEAHKAF